MKVIHIAGWSGSGKTTFIQELITALASLGKVGSIKHIGDHVCGMPARKDTTVHYDAGSAVTAGIDPEKTMITCRSVRLADSLDILADSGVRYAVVEGFKKVPFTKVVFGDLDIPALIRNPTVRDVISCLDRFDDYYTLSGLLQDCGDDSPAYVRYCMTGSFQDGTVDLTRCRILESELNGLNGVSLVRVRYNRRMPDFPGWFFVVCMAEDPECGCRVLTRCRDFFSGNSHGEMDGSRGNQS